MGKEIIINMEKEIFGGNVLDVGFENYGIIYGLCKKNDNALNIEYIEGSEERNFIEKNYYDSCVVFFSVKDIYTKLGKKKFLKEICKYLREDGYLHLWDINKGYSKIFNGDIKVILPDNKVKRISIKDYRVFTDNSAGTLAIIIQEYFQIIDLKCSDNIYYIRARKKI